MTQFLPKILKWIEIVSILIIAIAILLKLLNLSGAAELLLVSLSTLAIDYFFWSFLAVPQSVTASKTTLMEVLPATLSKVMFIGVSVLCVAYLFTFLHLKGANEMMMIGLLTLVGCVGLSMLMILGNRERMPKL